MELYDSLDERPSGIVIFFDELWFEVVDTTTGERIRLTIGEMDAEYVKDQRFDALVQVALIDSQAMAKSFAEIISDLEQKECVGALGTFRSLDGRMKFLGTILDTVAGMVAS